MNTTSSFPSAAVRRDSLRRPGLASIRRSVCLAAGLCGVMGVAWVADHYKYSVRVPPTSVAGVGFVPAPSDATVRPFYRTISR